MELTVPTDKQKHIQVRSRRGALYRVFDLNFNGIHMAKVILELLVVYWQNKPRCQLFPTGWEQRLYMSQEICQLEEG